MKGTGAIAAPSWPEHERVLVVDDRQHDLQAIVAIHSTALGPALGGIRMKHYPGGFPEAFEDALALSRAMSYKAAAAGLAAGGGKAVVIGGECSESQRERRLRGLAEIIDGLHGSYIGGPDVGTTVADVDAMLTRTQWLLGGSATREITGDTSGATVTTVLEAIRSGLAVATGDERLEGRTVAVVGLGKVGGDLTRRLLDHGARVLVYDIEADRGRDLASRPGVTTCEDVDQLLSAPVDVLAPCAVGGLIDARRARALDCKVVAGAANNPLADGAGEILDERGILVVPDFLANAGGLICGDCARRNLGPGALTEELVRSGELTREILEQAVAEGVPPREIAQRRALTRMAAARAGA